MAAVSHQFSDPRPLEDVHRHFLTEVSPWFATRGVRLTEAGEKNLTYTSSRWPLWVILVSIFLFPIGLLSLLTGKQKFLMHVSLIPEQSGTTVLFSGEVADQGIADRIPELPG